jgi:predicted CXXCH cytochrome family protein
MLRRAAIVLSLLACCAGASAQDGRTPKPVIEPAKGDQCVADTGFMRRNHMELLKHQRDDTVRAGDRAGKFSLQACIQCHASQKTNSVAQAETNFCVSCHSYAAVKIDCFECHASKPKAQGTAFHPVVPTGPGATGAMRLASQVRQAGREGATK